MALGTIAADPTCNLKIIPVGMNYFHAHKFRSRAVIEFGNPLEVPPELVEKYKTGDRRDAIGKMLDLVYTSLLSVTVTTPDYDTLMVSICGLLCVRMILIRNTVDPSRSPTLQSQGQEASFTNGC